MVEIKLDFKEQLLLLLFFSSKHQSNKTRLMKFLFLLEEFFELSSEKKLEFIEYDFGPWAQNFELLMTPIILSKVFTFHEEKRRKIFAFSQEKENIIEKFIVKTYLNDKRYQDKVGLIRFLCENYSNEKLNDLIQLVYILCPDYTSKSEIRTKILELPKDYNRYVIEEFVEKVPLKFVVKLFGEPQNLKKILNFFDVPNNDFKESDYVFLVNIFEMINLPYLESSDFNEHELLRILYNYPSNQCFKYLKLSLISVVSMSKFKFDEEIYRNLILYLLKALTLSWPLQHNQIDDFNNIFLGFKENLNLGSFFDDIPDLIEDEKINTESIIKDIKEFDLYIIDRMSKESNKKKRTDKETDQRKIDPLIADDEEEEKEDEGEDQELEESLLAEVI